MISEVSHISSSRTLSKSQTLLCDIKQLLVLFFLICQREDAFWWITRSFPVHIICASSMLLGFCMAGSFQAKICHFCMISATYNKPRSCSHHSQESCKKCSFRVIYHLIPWDEKRNITHAEILLSRTHISRAGSLAMWSGLQRPWGHHYPPQSERRKWESQNSGVRSQGARLGKQVLRIIDTQHWKGPNISGFTLDQRHFFLVEIPHLLDSPL